ncbi:MAG: SycD/LcrH family type III secretion system chaperone [Comamonadaceae bacterium]|nr:SycD/LcrH family type III secretion system chaperone [Comamonadaceae bacterium]
MPSTHSNSFAGDFDASQLIDQAQTMQKWLAAGGSVGDAMNISPERREALYQLGHGFYSQARFEDAFSVFSLLVIYEHMNERYLMALAGAAQMLGKYKDALQHYSTAALLLVNDPTPIFFSGECLIALGNFELATESLSLVIEIADESPAQQALKSRARILLASISQKSNSTASAGTSTTR